jgi:hypothetical protein
MGIGMMDIVSKPKADFKNASSRPKVSALYDSRRRLGGPFLSEEDFSCQAIVTMLKPQTTSASDD